MDEKSAVERVGAAYEKLTAANARIKSLEKKLADGTLTMKEGAELTDLRAQAFGTAFSGKVLDIAQDERESACTELLRKRCDDTDEVAEAAQRAALSRQGLNLTPPTAPFEEDRARKIGHSLEDDTVPDETIQRRAKSATETMIRSQYDRDMKQGAKTCAAAGLKTYIIRDSASGCCKWCDEVAGKFAYGSEPKDVYRRHDNCSCSVVYESGRGRQNVWSKQTWSREQEREYLRLRDEMAPKRLNAKQAQALRERVGGLTNFVSGGKISGGYYPEDINRAITQKDTNFVTKDINDPESIFGELVELVPKYENYYDIKAHGSPEAVKIYRSVVDAQELARIIMFRSDYHGEPIRLLCCETGKMKKGTCFAQELADLLGVTVLAPTEDFNVSTLGNVEISSPRGKKGKMKPFTPKPKGK